MDAAGAPAGGAVTGNAVTGDAVTGGGTSAGAPDGGAAIWGAGEAGSSGNVASCPQAARARKYAAAEAKRKVETDRDLRSADGCARAMATGCDVAACVAAECDEVECLLTKQPFGNMKNGTVSKDGAV
jgi:hypothetical protein